MIASAFQTMNAETDEEREDIAGIMCFQVGIIMAVLGTTQEHLFSKRKFNLQLFCTFG